MNSRENRDHQRLQMTRMLLMKRKLLYSKLDALLDEVSCWKDGLPSELNAEFDRLSEVIDSLSNQANHILTEIDRMESDAAEQFVKNYVATRGE